MHLSLLLEFLSGRGTVVLRSCMDIIAQYMCAYDLTESQDTLSPHCWTNHGFPNVQTAAGHLGGGIDIG